MDRARVRRLRALAWPSVLGCLSWLCRLLPWRTLRWISRPLGALAHSTIGRERRRALEHLTIAFPNATPSWRRRTARGAFQGQVQNLLELLHLAGKRLETLDRYVDVVGWEHLEGARASGRPVVLVTGHCGNWELLGAVFARREVPLAAVVRRVKEQSLEPLLDYLRGAFGTRTINRGEAGASRQLLAALRGGTVLLMLIDQDIRTDGVWVPFFGRLAHTPAGAARLAIKRDAVTLTAFAERLDDGRLCVSFGAPLELSDSPAQATAQLTRRIEEQVRRRPAQWPWWHRRWRTPAPPDDDPRVWRSVDR